MIMAQTSRALNPFLHRDFNGTIYKSRSQSSMNMNGRSPRVTQRLSLPSSAHFLQGAQRLRLQASSPRLLGHRKIAVAVRCEQRTDEGNSLNIWLGRIAMLSFAAAITVEISTGKGLLQNIGVTTPLPTVALALTVVVGLLTAYFIFESGSKD